MVFVTGATGLLGSHIIYFLLRSGHDVCALKRRSSNLDEVRAVFEQYTSGELLWDKIKWVEGDVLDVGSMEEVVGQVDYVYHCAAVVSFSVCRKEELLAVNFTGTKNIASLCLKNKVRLCYVSSIGALGDVENEKDFIDEETPVLENREHSVYSQSKLLSESVVWDFIRKGLNAVIVNPSILLGSGHWNRSSSRLFTMASKGIWVYTGGVVGYVDVRDVCELMIRLTEDQRVMGERFIVSGGNYSYQELFSCIAQAVHKRRPVLRMRPWMTEFAWRMLAVIGKISGREPQFTSATARSSQHKSYYSTAKIKALYPDYTFYTLEETIGWMSGTDKTVRQ